MLRLTLPENRKKGRLRFGKRVVVIIIKKGIIQVVCGRICSTKPLSGNVDGSHCGVDNVKKTVVDGDVPFNDLAYSADDAFERSFEVSDPLLLTLWEARRLRNRSASVRFFKGLFNPTIARDIARVLTSTDLK